MRYRKVSHSLPLKKIFLKNFKIWVEFWRENGCIYNRGVIVIVQDLS